MNPIAKPFIIKLLFLSIVIELICFGFYFFKPAFFSFYLIIQPVYFFAVIVFFHLSLLKSLQQRAQLFVSKYMMFTGIKLFLNLGILLAVVFILKEKLVLVVLGFLVNYIVYTVFEVKELLRVFSKNN